MNPTRLTLLFFAVIALAQLSAPGFMIWRQEQTLQHGKIFQLETVPVDPYDAFRGRYVALRFQQERVAKTLYPPAERNQKLYAQLKENDRGLAQVSALSLTPTPDSIPIKVSWTDADIIQLNFPFERYYLEESKAPQAEEAYRRQNRKAGGKKAYVTVRVLNGYAALDNLYIEDQPILEYLRSTRTSTPVN